MENRKGNSSSPVIFDNRHEHVNKKKLMMYDTAEKYHLRNTVDYLKSVTLKSANA